MQRETDTFPAAELFDGAAAAIGGALSVVHELVEAITPVAVRYGEADLADVGRLAGFVANQRGTVAELGRWLEELGRLVAPLADHADG
jgi:hypothetical protein